jgi:membrane fusion protein, multidrug efflux system
LARFFNASVLVFAVVIALVVTWIASGVLSREEPQPVVQRERAPTSVAAGWSEAERIERILSLYGDLEPQQVVTVRARTNGIVEEVAVQRGSFVNPGDRLAQLSLDDRPARLARAEAELATAERDFDAAVELLERGTGTRAAEQAARSRFEAARSALVAIEQEIENTELTAPIEGTVNRIIADVGTVVTVGGEMIEIVDNDPLIGVVQVPQYAVARLTIGGPARVEIAGREVREGVIRFIAPIADAATRTFRVEIEVANPDRDLPAGLSVSVRIPTEEVIAHKVSPALATLDEEGQVGLQAVDENDRVVFYPVEIVRAEAGGVWVSGLPERVRLITIREGPVSEGQQVLVRESPGRFGLAPLAAEEDAPEVPETTLGAEEIPAGGVVQ